MVLCIGFGWILRYGCCADEHELEGFKWTEWFLPYVYNSIFVLVVCRPYRYFVSLCSDVDDSTTDIITVVIKRFSHKAQKLKNKTRIERERTSKPLWSTNTANAVKPTGESIDLPSPTRSGPVRPCAAVWTGWSASGRPACFSHLPTWAQCHPAPKRAHGTI